MAANFGRAADDRNPKIPASLSISGMCLVEILLAAEQRQRGFQLLVGHPGRRDAEQRGIDAGPIEQAERSKSRARWRTGHRHQGAVSDVGQSQTGSSIAPGSISPTRFSSASSQSAS
jgi:hypothetical protein